MSMHLSLTASPRELACTLAARCPAPAPGHWTEHLRQVIRSVIVLHRATIGPVRRGAQILDLLQNREDLQEVLARLPDGLGTSRELAEAKQVVREYLSVTPPNAKAVLQSLLSVALAA